MNDLLAANADTIRLAIFLSLLGCLLLLEAYRPQRTRCQPRVTRWRTNIGVLVSGSVLLKILIPVTAIEVANVASTNGWGLLNQMSIPWLVKFCIAVILLDMLIYAQHVVFHRVPWLWRVHKVHHADRDFDVTTALRFHPVEIVASMLFKFMCILVFGAPALSVLVFEILLNGCAMFNHANLKLPKRFDSLIRYVLVTPDMHRVHHSVKPSETNANFGFCLSCWDKWFGTYINQPEHGHTDMRIGLPAHQDTSPASFLWCLYAPLAKQKRNLK